MATADGFVIRHGLVQYRPSQLRKYSRDGLCEICDWPPTGKPILLFDHCHTHGWIRGLICNICNDLVGCLETGRNHWRLLTPSLVAQLSAYRRNCPDCRDSEAASAA